MPLISIVLVSMNQVTNLSNCLDSIYKFTSSNFFIYVVAYLYSAENLKSIRKRYPNITIIESNQIRGFSENNNLALKLVTTEYTFILNDDTIFKEPVLDKLLHSLQKTTEATVMSPVLIHEDGSLQYCGRRKYTFSKYIISQLGIRMNFKSKYENKKGIFKSYNISGAAFLIKTKVLKEMGLFDESYFFCPEDIALSTKLNKNNYYCYVDSDTYITHLEGFTGTKSSLFYATSLARFLGTYIFLGQNRAKQHILFLIWYSKIYIMKFINTFRYSNHRKDFIFIYMNICKDIHRNITPKQAFIREYNKTKEKG